MHKNVVHCWLLPWFLCMQEMIWSTPNTQTFATTKTWLSKNCLIEKMIKEMFHWFSNCTFTLCQALPTCEFHWGKQKMARMKSMKWLPSSLVHPNNQRWKIFLWWQRLHCLSHQWQSTSFPCNKKQLRKEEMWRDNQNVAPSMHCSACWLCQCNQSCGTTFQWVKASTLLLIVVLHQTTTKSG